MKKQNESRLKESLHELLDSYHLAEKVNEQRLIQNWENLMGKTISKYTTEIKVRKKNLYLTVSSSALKQELLYSKAKIISIVNESIALGFIEEVIVR